MWGAADLGLRLWPERLELRLLLANSPLASIGWPIHSEFPGDVRMAAGNGRSVGRPPHLRCKILERPEPDDAVVGSWPRERLLEMDARFVERLERAIAAGDENRQAAAATHAANPTRAR